MIEKLKDELSSKGQSKKWFYDNFIKPDIDITYGGFMHQLNGYAPVSDQINVIIKKFLSGQKPE